ncbi:MAG: hypothetical protein ACR2QC_01505 [Gammaproteobacteria bacterium]
MKRCVDCGGAANSHPNAKYCELCSKERRKRPRSTLTPKQQREAISLCGILSRTEIGKRLNVSRGNVNRCFRAHGVYGRSDQYKRDIVDAVLSTYEKLGKIRTQELFPNVKIRSIVERYKDYSPRQIRWTDNQIIEAARMAGLVRHAAQAKFFNRPNAYEGSIKSFWVKRMNCSPIYINGMSSTLILQIAKPGVPAIIINHMNAGCPHPKVLWLDLIYWLRDDIDPVVRHSIETLAQFQAWLHGTHDSHKIRQMIAEREN